MSIEQHMQNHVLQDSLALLTTPTVALSRVPSLIPAYVPFIPPPAPFSPATNSMIKDEHFPFSIVQYKPPIVLDDVPYLTGPS